MRIYCFCKHERWRANRNCFFIYSFVFTRMILVSGEVVRGLRAKAKDAEEMTTTAIFSASSNINAIFSASSVFTLLRYFCATLRLLILFFFVSLSLPAYYVLLSSPPSLQLHCMSYFWAMFPDYICQNFDILAVTNVWKNDFGFHSNQLNNLHFKYQTCQMKLRHLNTFLQFRLFILWTPL